MVGGTDPAAAGWLATGWARIGPDPAILAWAQAALPLARLTVAESAEPWRCGGTWFAGVDALPNSPDGAAGGVPLPGAVLGALPWRPVRWHRAQLSTLRPGYPRPSPEESAAAFRFRATRDAAHVDGLLPVGPGRMRMLREPHAFILGLPLTASDPEAAPPVVWEGSHRIVLAAFRQALSSHPPDRWAEVDLTECYHGARREAFATCPRRTLPVAPGEALILHRAALHGMAPWNEGAGADPEGRMIAYFRPEFPAMRDWLDAA